MTKNETIEEYELMDSGMSTIGDLTNVKSMGDTLDTTGYPSSSYRWRSSRIELMSNSTTMNFSTFAYDIADIPDDESASPVYKTHSPSIVSSHTYTCPFVLMEDYEEDTSTSYGNMNDCPVNALRGMFVSYQPLTFDEKDSLKSERSSKFSFV